MDDFLGGAVPGEQVDDILLVALSLFKKHVQRFDEDALRREMQLVFEVCHFASHESSDEGLVLDLQSLDLGVGPVAGQHVPSGTSPLDFLRNVHEFFRVDAEIFLLILWGPFGLSQRLDVVGVLFSGRMQLTRSLSDLITGLVVSLRTDPRDHSDVTSRVSLGLPSVRVVSVGTVW